MLAGFSFGSTAKRGPTADHLELALNGHVLASSEHEPEDQERDEQSEDENRCRRHEALNPDVDLVGLAPRGLDGDYHWFKILNDLRDAVIRPESQAMIQLDARLVACESAPR